MTWLTWPVMCRSGGSAVPAPAPSALLLAGPWPGLVLGPGPAWVQDPTGELGWRAGEAEAAAAGWRWRSRWMASTYAVTCGGPCKHARRFTTSALIPRAARPNCPMHIPRLRPRCSTHTPVGRVP